MILITAFPRSGTGFTADLLTRCGLKIGHEIILNDGVSSWLHASPAGCVPWLEKEVESQEWQTIVHQVRHPLAVISSAETLSDEAFEYMFRALGEVPDGERGLKWYMWTWFKWNELIEKQAHIRIKVEDLCEKKAVASLIEKIGGHLPENIPPKDVNTRPHGQYTWSDLEKVDPKLCRRVKEKAADYGYHVIKFGATMIGKDEEDSLPRCLESIKDVVDEIIFVDTGSTDNTVEIAESYGAKVYHHPWQKNFSLHRNQSMGYSTCDWVFQIDCDEELCGDKKALRRYIEAVSGSNYNAMALLMKDMQGDRVAMQSNMSRIFRRGAVHYEDIVHNRPVYDGAAAMPETVEYWFNHYGYDLEPEKKQKKLDRTKELLEKRINENPKDYQAYFYLSQIMGELDDIEKAKKYCEFYIKNRKDVKGNGFNRSVFYTHLQSITATEGYTETYQKALNEYMNEMPNDIDITFAALRYAEATDKPVLLRTACERYINIFQQYSDNPHMQASRFTYHYQPESLALAMFHLSTLSLRTGLKALSNFKNIAKTVGGGFAESALEDMAGACAQMGISFLETQGEINAI